MVGCDPTDDGCNVGCWFPRVREVIPVLIQRSCWQQRRDLGLPHVGAARMGQRKTLPPSPRATSVFPTHLVQAGDREVPRRLDAEPRRFAVVHTGFFP